MKWFFIAALAGVAILQTAPTLIKAEATGKYLIHLVAFIISFIIFMESIKEGGNV